MIDFPYKSFIGGWNIPHEICDKVVDFYDKRPKWHRPGSLGFQEPNADVKDSMDMTFSFDENIPPLDEYISHLNNVLQSYLARYEWAKRIMPFGLTKNYNIQKYPVGGGFKHWHNERAGIMGVSSRVLVWMTYLNDVPDGGTEFYYQDLYCPAEKGLTLIWPTDWTHTHKGRVSHTQEKYIITGWFNFLELEE